MSKLGDRPSFLRLVRWAAACLLIALGLTLSAASWSGYLVVRGALNTVVQGQGEALIQAVDQALVRVSRNGTTDDAEALRAVLDNEAPRGLRCVVLLDLPGGLLPGQTPGVIGSPLQAGDCLTPQGLWAELGARFSND